MKDLGVRVRKLVVVGSALMAGCGGLRAVAAQPSPAAIGQFDRYVSRVEARLAGQHESRTRFFVSARAGVRPQPGQVDIEEVAVPYEAGLQGAMVHHWRATAYAPGASARDFEALMRDVPAYPRRFEPEVVSAALVAQAGDTMETSIRVREQHVLTVWMDVSYDVRFGVLDDAHRFSISRSTRVRELSGVGTPGERALGPDEEHGWLWRMNTYWSYEEGDGGLYLQVESVSLTAAIPRGLGWAVGPYVASIPRSSLQSTMQAVCRAIQKQQGETR